MKRPKEIDFMERRNTAAAAKKQLVDKLQQAPKLDDPALLASRAERASIKAVNALQRAERAKVKREAEVRQKAEDDARALAAAAAAQAELDAAVERSAKEKAEQKAERDRRYAARKDRSR